jgi:hypothetical protein
VNSSSVLFKFFAPVILAACVFAYCACSGPIEAINPSSTDVVTITDINKFITDADIKAGVKRTNNYVSPVRMSHQKHESRKIECKLCHHKNGNDDRIKQCAACHKGKAGDTTMHEFCIGCHVKDKSKEAPTMCQDCHKAVSAEQ